MKQSNIFRTVDLSAGVAAAMSFSLVSCGGSQAKQTPVADTTHADTVVAEAPEPAEPHWAYEGEKGPERWATICDEYSSCAGHSQSPIDLKGGTLAKGLGDLKTMYADSMSFSAVNNGHTVQVNIAEEGKLTIAGRTYSIKQFHFHATSEHTINGAKFPMEAHLVHADDSGHIAVIGVMFTEGKENPFLAKFINALPAKAETDTTANIKFSLANLFPKDKAYFRYTGSLTTPPCTEGVTWTVLKTPVTASKEQIAKMANMMPEENARPVQPIGDRKIEMSK